MGIVYLRPSHIEILLFAGRRGEEFTTREAQDAIGSTSGEVFQRVAELADDAGLGLLEFRIESKQAARAAGRKRPVRLFRLTDAGDIVYSELRKLRAAQSAQRTIPKNAPAIPILVPDAEGRR